MKKRWLAAMVPLCVFFGVEACSGDSGSTSETPDGGCPTGFEDCSGTCVATGLDPANCGACGNACAEGEVCSQGTCATACGGGATDCGGLCIDTKVDPANCGACGTACAEGEVCSAGSCALQCSGGTTDCSGLCVDTKVDPANCGACGTACGEGEVCSMGACALQCAGGTTDCSGLCVDTNLDPANCGACGTACAQDEVCSMGACGLTCVGGSTNCNGVCVNTQNDIAHCGGCDMACAQGEVCSTGACGLECVGGSTKCGTACVDLLGDPANCGACGTACTANQVCSGGACIDKCPAPNQLCGNSCVNVQSDPAHCGTCNSACAGDEACKGGACVKLAGCTNFTQASYSASAVFKDQLTSTTMMIAWDGTNYWSCSGGSGSGQRLASYTAAGALVAKYSPGLDFRSVFTKGDGATPLYARAFSNMVIRRQTSPGVFTNDVTLAGPNLDSQSAVVWDAGNNEWIAQKDGALRRFAPAGTNVATLTLQGYGSLNQEGDYPQERNLAWAGGCYLTYAKGVLSAWDKAGKRVDTATLTGAGTGFDSHFSMSYANGMVFVVDTPGGNWRGYKVGK